MSERLRVFYFPWRRARWRELLASSEKIAFAEAPIDPRRDFGLAFVRASLAAFRRARRFRPDLVLAESLGLDGLMAVVFARRLGVPIAVRLKGDPWLELGENAEEVGERAAKAARIAIAARVLIVADWILPVSEPLASEARARLGVGRQIAVVENPLAAPSPRPPEPRRPERLLTVTNFGFRRKIAPLLAAIPIVAPTLDRFGLHWTILGDGRHLAAARRELAPLPPAIELVGWDSVEAWYETWPIVALVTGLDALPNALLEAAARGLPIVVNRGSPIEHWIEDGRTGLVLDFTSAETISAALERLLVEPAFAVALGEAARAWAEKRFGLARVRARLEAVLGDVAGPHRGRSEPV